jgi:hypothetical protein
MVDILARILKRNYRRCPKCGRKHNDGLTEAEDKQYCPTDWCYKCRRNFFYRALGEGLTNFLTQCKVKKLTIV